MSAETYLQNFEENTLLMFQLEISSNGQSRVIREMGLFAHTVHGWTRDRLLPATLCQGPTSERALTAPSRSREGAASGVSQQTSTTRPLRAAAESRGVAAEQNAPAPEPPMNSVRAVERAASRENSVQKTKHV